MALERSKLLILKLKFIKKGETYLILARNNNLKYQFYA